MCSLRVGLRYLVRGVVQPASLFGLSIIVLGWILVVYQLSSERNNAMDQAILRGSGWARMVADATFQLISGIDRSLLILRQDYEENPEQFDLHKRAARIAAVNNVTSDVALIDASGFLRARTGYSGPPIDLSQREHFQLHLHAQRDELVVSRPVVLKVSGRPQIQLSRRLRKFDGSFDGVVSASIDPSFVERFQRTVGIGEDSAIVVRGFDGFPRASYGLKSDAIRSSRATSEALGHSPDGFVWGAANQDGTKRLVTYRSIPEYSLEIAFGESERRIFDGYGHSRDIYITVAAILTVLVLLAAAFLVYRQLALAAVAETSERISRERDIAINSMSQGLCLFDAAQRLIISNKKYAEIYGLRQDQLRPGMTLREIFEYRKAAGTAPEDHYRYVQERIAEASANKPHHHVQKLRDRRYIAVVHQPTPTGGWVATHEDVTDRKLVEAKISHMARHDALTGLGNRATLMEKIEEASARCRRHGETFSVFVLDLDRFKQVNDTLGHPAGDTLLQEVATRLRECLRETDAIARLGGDEFAIIQAGEPNQRESASRLAERIIAELAKPFSVEGNEIYVGASVGIALAPEHSTNADDLLKMSDMALYRAKESGRNCHRIFDVEMTEIMSRRHELEHDLRHAIDNDELYLHYQPIIDTKTLKMCGAEALIRWRHPTKGMITPERFIPLAEETGLISQLGQWVLHTACLEAATWPAGIKLAVNLSPKQFNDENLIDVVMYILAESGLPPERLELEITETALIESAARVLPVLRQLKNIGISIALDDFGTGYSSLSQLTIFPFDKIKIDKSFTQKMTTRADCAAVVSATMTLARSLDKQTTAEGVETVGQYRSLCLAGVTSLQGFLFKRPCPASDLDFDYVYRESDIKQNAA